MLKQSYLSPQIIDETTQNHAYAKINAVIIDDVDKNGYIDIITFPSAFSIGQPFDPVVWSNTQGKFQANPSVIKGQGDYQYFRDSVAGDFNNDGFTDYIQIDQGWELNNRDPKFFFGGKPVMLKGTANGLEWIEAKDFIKAKDGGLTFNHIGATADFDQDGDLDLAIAAMTPTNSKQYRLYVNDGTGHFTWNEQAIPYSAREASGTTFLKSGDHYVLINGFYRMFSLDDFKPTPVVMEYANGAFTESYRLVKPDLGGRERNYGAVDMYNKDLNGDGREDLLITWETEPSKGIDDGLSNLSGDPRSSRYADVSNTFVTVWFQDANGKIMADAKSPVINLDPLSSGSQVYFADFNHDGKMDFWATSYGVRPQDAYKQIFINDGRGNFANPSSHSWKLTESFPDWYQVSPYFFDVDNDGDMDLVAQRAIIEHTNKQRNIGEELRVFINDAPQPNPVVNQVYQLYKTIFDREPDVEGAKHWIAKIQAGLTLAQAADVFVGSKEFADRHGTDGNENLLLRCYQNVLGRSPDAGGYAWWADKMAHNAEVYTPAHVVSSFMYIADDLDIVGVQPTNPELYL